MRKLFNVLTLLLAMHFLALAGFGIWLHQGGRLDRAKVMAIKDILFPPPEPAGAATQPAAIDAAAQPSLKLEELLAKHAGLPVAEQVNIIRASFDNQMAMLDRRQRDMDAQKRLIEAAQAKCSVDRQLLDEERKNLELQTKEAVRLASDKGFQDSMELYKSLPAKQVKTIFMGLDDATVVQYLQAMEPRVAAKITKEFKQPDEAERLKRILERMRLAQANTGKEP